MTCLPEASARSRVTIMRAAGKPSPSGGQPPSNSSMTSPVFLLVTHAVGLSSQRALELGMLQNAISSPPCHQRDPCLVSRCALTPASPYCPSRRTKATSGGSAKCFKEVEMPRKAEASSPRSSPLPRPAYVPTRFSRMQMPRRGAGAHRLTALASGVARRADHVEPSLRRRESRIAGQGRLSRRLAGGINIKDHGATSLPVEAATNGFGGPRISQSWTARRVSEKLRSRDDRHRPRSGSSWIDAADFCAQTRP